MAVLHLTEGDGDDDSDNESDSESDSDDDFDGSDDQESERREHMRSRRSRPKAKPLKAKQGHLSNLHTLAFPRILSHGCTSPFTEAEAAVLTEDGGLFTWQEHTVGESGVHNSHQRCWAFIYM